MAKEVHFTIKDGEISMDLKGFNGVGCKDLANKFNSLGAQTKEVLKPEIHNQESCSNTVTAKA